MPASEARILANQRNAARSTGPKTVEGKEQSRRNSLKHGLTGAGIVLPESDAAEIDRKARAYVHELNITSELGRDLARRAALNAVRMDRAADQQTASLTGRVRQAEAEARANGEDPAEAARIAMFDPSPEATLARKYEMAAERGFYRALKELRQLERPVQVASPVADDPMDREMMGSFTDWLNSDAALDAVARFNSQMPVWPAEFSPIPPSKDAGDLPITVGKRG